MKTPLTIDPGAKIIGTVESIAPDNIDLTLKAKEIADKYHKLKPRMGEV